MITKFPTLEVYKQIDLYEVYIYFGSEQIKLAFLTIDEIFNDTMIRDIKYILPFIDLSLL